MRNYISYNGTITFFDNDSPPPTPPEGAAVWMRPAGPAWYGVPQIKGDYSLEDLPEEN